MTYYRYQQETSILDRQPRSVLVKVSPLLTNFRPRLVHYKFQLDMGTHFCTTASRPLELFTLQLFCFVCVLVLWCLLVVYRSVGLVLDAFNKKGEFLIDGHSLHVLYVGALVVFSPS